MKNIYAKMQEAKKVFLAKNIKKSGKNKFANYSYYELADITPALIEICDSVGLFTGFSFDKDIATLTIVNIDNPEERLIYTSPMEELELKGANRIQALGGTETYQRRYLYMAAFDIIENDMFDAVVSEEKQVAKKLTSPAKPIKETHNELMTMETKTAIANVLLEKGLAPAVEMPKIVSALGINGITNVLEADKDSILDYIESNY